MPLLAFLFVAVSATELALLVEVGSRIGTPATFLIILVTGVLGAALARAQGLSVLRAIQRDLEQGRAPTTAIVDGAIVLVAATLLVTPGFLTDAIGLAGLIPPLRALLRRWAWRGIQRAIERRTIHVQTFSTGGSGADAFESGGFRGGGFERGQTVETEYEVCSEDDDDAPQLPGRDRRDGERSERERGDDSTGARDPVRRRSRGPGAPVD